jgi:hypothetical protein
VVFVKDDLRQRWRDANQGTGLRVEALDDTGVRLQVRPGATTVLSMAGVPDRFNVAVQASDVTVRLTDVRPDTYVSLTVTPAGPVHLELADTAAGEVHVYRTASSASDVDSTDQSVSIEADHGCATDLHLHRAFGKIAAAPDLTVALHDSSLRCAGPIKALTLSGTVTLDLNGPVHLEALAVAGRANLHLTRPSFLHPLALSGDSADATLRMTTDADPPSPLTTGSVTTLTVTSHPRMVLQAQTASDLVLSGQVALQLKASGTALRVTGTRKGAHVPTLRADTHAVCTELAGEFTLGRVCGAHLEGGTDGFAISGLEPAEPGGDSPVKNAVLRGFRVPDGLAGRTLLAELDETFHLDPDTSQLPGTSSEFKLLAAIGKRNPRGIFLGGPPPGTPDGELRQNAELVRELRRLAVTKGAPGSTRSTIGWASYRLRHATTSGFAERSALSGYRVLGYGERPGPALVTWLLLTVVGAAIISRNRPWDPTFGGVWRFLGEMLDQAAGPLAAVMRSGAPSATEPYEYILRALIAIPLITAAIAFRNYVKDGNPS